MSYAGECPHGIVPEPDSKLPCLTCLTELLAGTARWAEAMGFAFTTQAERLQKAASAGIPHFLVSSAGDARCIRGVTAAMGTLEEMTAFARARLDEDEAAAEANIGAGPGWQHGVGDHEGGEPIWPDYQTHESDDLAAAERYLERFRPLRMLRDVAAKRAILDLCRTETDETSGRPLALRIVQHMVTEWDDHPDYKAGWKP